MLAIQIKSALHMWIGWVIMSSSSVSSKNDSSTIDWAKLDDLPDLPESHKTRLNWWDWIHLFDKHGRACKGSEYVNCNTYDFTYGGRDYRFFRRPLSNWFTAFYVCCAIGGFLAIPRSQDEVNKWSRVAHGIQPPSSIHHVAPWIGIHDILQTGKFQRFTRKGHTDFDVKAQSFEWGPGYPKSHYNEASCVWSTVDAGVDNVIENKPCTTEKTFMCEVNL